MQKWFYLEHRIPEGDNIMLGSASYADPKNDLLFEEFEMIMYKLSDHQGKDTDIQVGRINCLYLLKKDIINAMHVLLTFC